MDERLLANAERISLLRYGPMRGEFRASDGVECSSAIELSAVTASSFGLGRVATTRAGGLRIDHSKRRSGLSNQQIGR